MKATGNAADDMFDRAIYLYPADNIRVIDGDTIEADVDLGFEIRWRRVFRLNGIDAPEKRGEDWAAGHLAMCKLMEFLAGKAVMLETIKDGRGKYGRYLAIVWTEDRDGNVVNVNDWMVDNGYAKVRFWSPFIVEDEQGKSRLEFGSDCEGG